MDITARFKACVKTAQMKIKSIGQTDKKPDSGKKTAKESRLSKPREVALHLKYLEKFLKENCRSYISYKVHLSSAVVLSDAQKNTIEESAQSILETCTTLLKSFKSDCDQIKKPSQAKEHYMNVYDSLNNSLKSVKQLYIEQKKSRMRQTLGGQKLAKLETKYDFVASEKAETAADKSTVSTGQSVNSPPKIPTPTEQSSLIADDELTAEEMQIFELENDTLYNELSAISEEVQQIGSKVQQIAHLQEVFTEKVLEQEKDIERILTNVTGATENVKGANEQIRQAIQRNAGLRVWVLFFMLVMSFSLLFLDWFND